MSLLVESSGIFLSSTTFSTSMVVLTFLAGGTRVPSLWYCSTIAEVLATVLE